MGKNLKIIEGGSWVEIHRIVLEAGERATQVPDDTKKVPLEMKVKGYLNGDAKLDDEVEIVTAVGRVVVGRLTAENPPYDHGFGEPILELMSIGREVKDILRDIDNCDNGDNGRGKGR